MARELGRLEAAEQAFAESLGKASAPADPEVDPGGAQPKLIFARLQVSWIDPGQATSTTTLTNADGPRYRWHTRKVTRKIDPTEVRNAEIHRRLAAEIRRDPRIIEQAAARLDRWMLRDGDPPDPALVEWKTALAMLDAGQLADFLESRTPRAKRMRISSPFFWPAR